VRSTAAGELIIDQKQYDQVSANSRNSRNAFVATQVEKVEEDNNEQGSSGEDKKVDVNN
jgi:hypothetical protein